MSKKYSKLVHFDSELKRTLQEVADSSDRSVNWVINDIVKKALSTKRSEKKPAKVEPRNEQIIEVPNFIDGDLWLAFMDVRKKLKAPATDSAYKLLIGKLEKMYNNGFDPNEALKASIENGWKGVFEPKVKQQASFALGDF